MPINAAGLDEASLRALVFVLVLLLMMILETLWPRKVRVQTRQRRWLANLGLVLISALMMRILVSISAVGVASIASAHGYGLLNLVDLPVIVSFILAVIALDMAVYVQHVISHKVPLFWRLHKVHHADRDIDTTTGLRFHPGEILLSMFYKMAIVLLLGPSAIAVLIFEILLNATAMFNHANFKIPLGLDKVMRVLIVTPDMHRVHHSVIRAETDSNYGFNLSLWDRIFRTYKAQPENGHDDMLIGLSQYQTEKPANLIWDLALPFEPQEKDRNGF